MTLRTSRHRPRSIWSRHGAQVERTAVVLAALAVASFLFAFESRATVASGELRVWFFDIGQGDATLIITPDGHQILVDGGPDRAVLAKLGEVLPPWDRTLDVVVATHPDADHIGGLAAVLDRYEVARVVSNGDDKDTSVADAFNAAREAEPGAALEIGQRGHTLAFGDVTLTELWPIPEALADEDTNVASIVYRLDYGETSVLLMGDATEAVELAMMQGREESKESKESEGSKDKENNFDVDVLKAGHHGSATSSSYPFVQATRPEIVVISSGADNRYGHPHPAVIDRFLDLGSAIWRTDLDGDILLTSNGGAPTVRAAPLPF